MGKGQKRAPLRKAHSEKKKAPKLSSSSEARDTTASVDEEADSSDEKVVQHGDASDSDSDSDSEDELMLDKQQTGELIDMAFDFNDMKEEYSHGIAKMLKHLTSNEPDGIKLAEVICQQDVVGTAVCCDEGSDVFAYATVLPMSMVKDDEYFGPIISDLLSAFIKLSSSAEKDTFESHLSGDKVTTTGLFLHGRFMNLPLQLCGALHSNLVDDLNWAKDREDEDNDPNAFKGMAFVLLIVPCAMESGQEVAKKTCVDIKGNNSVLFDSFEDDVYFQESLCAYAFKSANSENTLAALLVPMSSLISCVSQIQALTAA